MTSIASACARSTASTAELPQSAVTIRAQPRSRARSACTGWKPYPSRSRCGRIGFAAMPQAVSTATSRAVEEIPSTS